MDLSNLASTMNVSHDCMRELWHTTALGQKIKIKDLSNMHLSNTIKRYYRVGAESMNLTLPISVYENESATRLPF